MTCGLVSGHLQLIFLLLLLLIVVVTNIKGLCSSKSIMNLDKSNFSMDKKYSNSKIIYLIQIKTLWNTSLHMELFNEDNEICLNSFCQLIPISGIVNSIHNNITTEGHASFILNSDNKTISGRIVLSSINVIYRIEEIEDNNKMQLFHDNHILCNQTELGKMRRKLDWMVATNNHLFDSSSIQHLKMIRKPKKGHICPMKVTFDLSLYRKLQGNSLKITKLAMELIQALNEIYKKNKIQLNKHDKNLEFRLKKVFSVNERICSSSKYAKNILCKKPGSKIDPNYFLRMFSKQDYSDYCLSYLFTNHEFGGTLGVAYVGGICADYDRVVDKLTHIREYRSINAGFITIHDPIYGLSKAEYSLAHEIGHNLGASHDTRLNCRSQTPVLDYLMSPLAPIGETQTSRKFSVCSLQAIDNIVKDLNRGYKRWCFKEENLSIKNPIRNLTIIQDSDIDKMIDEDSNDDNIKWILAGIFVGIALIILVIIGFLIYAYMEQKYCFAPHNPNLTSNIDASKSFLRPQNILLSFKRTSAEKTPKTRLHFDKNKIMTHKPQIISTNRKLPKLNPVDDELQPQTSNVKMMSKIFEELSSRNQ